MRSLKLIAATALVSMITGINPAFAATSPNETVSISSSIANVLSWSSGSLAFGAYDPVVTNSSTNLTGSGSLSFSITKGDTVTITLGASANASTCSSKVTATYTRAMVSGSNCMIYELYEDSAHTTPWKGTASPTIPASTTGLSATSVNLYGVVPAGQDLPAGASYTDTVYAVVTY